MLLLDLLRTRNPGLPLPRILAYESCWYPIRAFFTCLYHMQVEGREHVPRRGGVLVVANHQTNFDPPLMAVGCRRHFHFVAVLKSPPTITWVASSGMSSRMAANCSRRREPGEAATSMWVE